MFSRIRELRKAQGLTLAELAARCSPPTTAVTIGRLETGMRQLTLAWMERIADALGVDPKSLIAEPGDSPVPVAALLKADGPEAPTEPLSLHIPTPSQGSIGLLIHASQGDYRAGDQLWLEQLAPPRFAEALNLDILAPRPVGRFVFGRLMEIEGPNLRILPNRPGATPVTLKNTPWIARTSFLIRPLAS